ncbi:MAG TPA: SRPBCC family protein [Acidimicrobiales bacterium]|nr:SRPBCC family protein [Acidimicrobiales bacterium]
MTVIEARTTIEADPGVVFDVAADPAYATRLVDGLSEWRALGKKVRGKGARFGATFKFGPATYEANLVIAEWDPPKAVAWRSESGADQSLAWLLEPSPNGTSVLFRLGFDPPQGVAGVMFSLTVEPALRAKANGTVAELKRLAEQR